MKRRRGSLTAGALVLAAMAGLPAVASAQSDLTGVWLARGHEDGPERGPGPEVGEYQGLPINDAARDRAHSWSSSSWNVIERMCIPHPSDYRVNFSHFEFSKIENPATFELVGYRHRHGWMNEFGASDRTIWMDGRPHPPAEAKHTWEGFSTGVWNGDVLTVTTTHLKAGYLRRNGAARSDHATLRELFFRHGNIMTVVSITEDPVYLTEPFVKSRNFILGLGHQMTPFPCSLDVEIPQEPGWVPHYLPGANEFVYDFAEKHHLPREASDGGANTMYPEFMLKLRAPARAAGSR